MKRVAMLCALMGVVLAFNGAWADDYNPPEWRTEPPGQDRTTYQRWEFGDNNPMPAPDELASPFQAPPTLAVLGDTRLWMPHDMGEEGVWKFEDYIRIEIANFDDQFPLKEIWMQLTYWANFDPIIYADDPMGKRFFGEQVDKEAAGDYFHATWQIIIEPNPRLETIYIEPRNCTTYIDEIVIDTICTVPEPTTICLLGLGALALLRKRKP